MPGAALAYKDEYDEVPVSSTTEVLEANVTALRDSLNEFKTEVRTDLGHMNGEIKSLRGEIASVRENLTGEIKSLRDEMTGEIRSLRDEMTGEIKSLRERTDKGFERLFTKFEAELKETNKALSELSKTVLKIDSRQGAVLWVCGGLAALITLVISVGKAFNWF